MSKARKILILCLILIALAPAVYFLFFKEQESEPTELIFVDIPQPNQVIQSPLLVSGKARGNWFFEASFPIELLDENGELVTVVVAQAEGEWMTTEFVPFSAIVDFPASLKGKGTLVFKKDNPSGLPEFDDETRVPIIFAEVETMKVKAFFNNENLDPEFSCNKVFPVTREVAKTEAVARAVLEALLKGPTQKEKTDGFLTSINTGVKIQKLVIENNIAKVDFDEMLEFQVGGSCRVAAIRAQITETLKQFPSVKDVIISINDRTEDILQP